MNECFSEKFSAVVFYRKLLLGVTNDEWSQKTKVALFLQTKQVLTNNSLLGCIIYYQLFPLSSYLLMELKRMLCLLQIPQ